MAQYQGGFVDVGNDICHRERLARTSYAEQHLCLVATKQAVRQLADGFGLVAGRLVLGYKIEVWHKSGCKDSAKWSKNQIYYLMFHV